MFSTKGQDKDGNKGKKKISSGYLGNVHMSGGITSSFIGAWRMEILGTEKSEVASLEWSEVMHKGDTRRFGKIRQVCGSDVQTVYCNITRAMVAERLFSRQQFPKEFEH